MNHLIELLNAQGDAVWEFVRPMLWQSSVVIVLVLLIDRVLRAHTSAATRYVFSLLILVKLLMPPTWSSPTSPAYWLKEQQIASQPVTKSLPQQSTVSYRDARSSAETPAAEIVPVTRLNQAGALWFCALLGMLMFIGLLLARLWKLKRLLSTSSPVSPETEQLVAECSRQIGLSRTLSVRTIDRPMSPALCGVWNPVILLPTELLQSLSDEELRCVILHELSHHQRRDVLVNWLQTVLQIAYWWHPLVWIANAHIRCVREQAVDESVMVALQTESEAYLLTLVKVARQYLARPMMSLGLVGIMETRHALKSRIEHLVAFSPERPVKLGWRGVSSVVLAAFILLPLARAQDKATPDEKNSGSPRENSARKKEQAGNLWQTWSPEAVTAARNSNQVVLVNFQADWDMTGKLNLKSSLETPLVKEIVDKTITALFKADATHENAAIQTELKKFNRPGVPLTVIYPRDKRQPPILLPELLTESIVTNALIKAARFGPGVLIEARFITVSLNSNPLNRPHRFSGILSAEENLRLNEQLKTQKGVDILSAPRITTASGLQSSISVGPTLTYVTAQGTTNRVTDGVTLEVMPTVDVETKQISLEVIASIKGFLGYTNKPVVMPVFKELSITNSATLLDGQVLVLGDAPTDKDKAPIKDGSQLLVLVKVKLTDDAP
ncbi:MAG: mecR1 3 [Verrucomicrobia bacterium]|jgi:bla regulator protein BlaR1|nr:mecR1 3 [Verrucomicrobiota bacterium]